MKANELRIGNYLDYYGQTCFVLELLRNDYAEFGYFTDSIGFNRKLTEKHSPKPIPLTEDWLLKFGFEKKVNKFDNRYDNDYGFEIEVQGDKYAYCVWDESAPYLTTFLGHCKHVHQLQNLYFALTGEELTIKE